MVEDEHAFILVATQGHWLLISSEYPNLDILIFYFVILWHLEMSTSSGLMSTVIESTELKSMAQIQ